MFLADKWKKEVIKVKKISNAKVLIGIINHLVLYRP